MTQARSTVLRDGQQSQVNSSELVPETSCCWQRVMRSARTHVWSAPVPCWLLSRPDRRVSPVEKENTVLQGVIPLGRSRQHGLQGHCRHAGRRSGGCCRHRHGDRDGQHRHDAVAGRGRTDTAQQGLDSAGRMLGIGVIGIAVIVMSVNYLTSTDHSVANLIAILILGVSLAVAAVPEGCQPS